MTEDEAKQRWCPFASSRVVSWKKSPVELVNAVQAIAEGHAPTTTCIASACMAWRTQGRSNGSNFYKEGYCGLAGAPQ